MIIRAFPAVLGETERRLYSFLQLHRRGIFHQGLRRPVVYRLIMLVCVIHMSMRGYDGELVKDSVAQITKSKVGIRLHMTSIDPTIWTLARWRSTSAGYSNVDSTAPRASRSNLSSRSSAKEDGLTSYSSDHVGTQGLQPCARTHLVEVEHQIQLANVIKERVYIIRSPSANRESG